MAKVAERYFKTSPWTIVEEGFDPARNRISESVFSLANEYMGTRGYFEEGYSGDHLVGSYINGLYEVMDIQHPQVFKGIRTRRAFGVNSVDWLFTRLRLDGETLDVNTSSITDFSRCLDMKHGTLTREFVWCVGDKQLKVTFLRFLSLVTGNLGALRITLEPIDFSGTLEFTSGLDFSPPHEIASGWTQVKEGGAAKGAGKNFWSCPKKGCCDDMIGVAGVTERSGQMVFAGCRLPGQTGQEVIEAEKSIVFEGKLDLEQGRTTVLDKVAFVEWERSENANVDAAWHDWTTSASKCLAVSFDNGLADHCSAWEKAWEILDIELNGDEEIQQGVRFSLFNLYQTYRGKDPRLNLPCKGLTAEVYYGWVFWDSETYCLPFYLFTFPEAARNLIEYRHIFMPQAIDRAQELDCDGARWPFATIDGTECCGTWQHCDLEVHINVAVFYAIWLYSKIRQDKDYLHDKCLEMLIRICKFFASRGEWGQKTGQFGIFGVMGPDEYHMMVNNNCYTNVMVKKTFEFTLEVMAELWESNPSRLAELFEQVGVDDTEPEEWRRMAETMRIPYDEETGLYEQHDGFFDLPHVDVKNLPAEQIPIYASWVYEKIFRHDMIKQPDLLLLPLFFSHDYSLESKRTNYEYYESRCIHESSLSPGIHSILATELGKHDEAYEFFRYMARLDIDNYNRNSDQGLHTTAMSGTWLNIVYGFAGMRTDGDKLLFQPVLPRQWSSYKFTLVYLDSKLAIEISNDGASFRTTSGPAVALLVYGQEHQVDEKGVCIPLQEAGVPQPESQS